MEEPPAAVVNALDGAADETLRATIAYCGAKLDSKDNEEPERDDKVPDKFEGDEEQWADAVEDCEAPSRATLTTKEINENCYLYYQWREGEAIKSEYVAPVNSKR